MAGAARGAGRNTGHVHARAGVARVDRRLERHEIIIADTAFGPALAVGSGPFKNFTLYYITSDHGHSFGCTAGATSTPFGADRLHRAVERQERRMASDHHFG